MKNTLKFALVGALLAVAAPAASAANCQTISKQVAYAVKANPSHVLAIVKDRVASNSGCACEVVKAAIVATEANKNLVAKIVDTAISASPKEKSLIVACASAIAPDAHAQIMKVSAKHSGGTDDHKKKETKYLDPINGGAGKANGKQGGAAGGGTGEFLDALDAIGLDATGNFSPTDVVLPGSNGGAGGLFSPTGGSN